MAAQLQIPSIHPFSPHGESSQVAQKWSKWKKSFQYFVTASGVRDDGRRKALLLHLVGPQTQDVFETLGVANDATYQESFDAIDGHFNMQRYALLQNFENGYWLKLVLRYKEYENWEEQKKLPSYWHTNLKRQKR